MVKCTYITPLLLLCFIERCGVARVVRRGLCGRVVRVLAGLCGGLCEGCVGMVVDFHMYVAYGLLIVHGFLHLFMVSRGSK